jgi:hypothetical protein
MTRLSNQLRSMHCDDGAVILDLRRGRMFRFNATGSRILELLRLGTEDSEISRLLVQEFSADPATVASDTCAFLAALRENALLDPKPQN